MTKQTKTLEFHPAASLYPDLTEAEYEELKSSIADIGQTVPIPTYKGKAIDGRARERACHELGIEPNTEEIENPGSLVELNYALNSARRHLTSSQKAAVAVERKARLAQEAKERQKTGKSADGKAGGRGHKKNLPQKVGEGNGTGGTKGKHAHESAVQAAKALNTNAEYVRGAERVKKQDPGLFQKILNADLTVPQALKKLDSSRKQERAPAEEGTAQLSETLYALKSVLSILERNEPLLGQLIAALPGEAKGQLRAKLGSIARIVTKMQATVEEKEALR